LEAFGKSFSGPDMGSKLKGKQELLSLLIANEHSRLEVWLSPLDAGKKHHFTTGYHKGIVPDVSVHPELLTVY
jgi:phosphatidylinositol 4-kinase